MGSFYYFFPKGLYNVASTLDGKLVVAISSRALFDFEEENLVFEQTPEL